MNKFIANNKLVIPEEEIDNVYIWTRISRTQEALLPSESYYNLVKHSFDIDTKKVVSVLKERFPNISQESYKFCDYITFTANKSRIFNGKTCFAYMNDMKMLESLACYLAHTMNQYLPEEDSLGSLIINKIDEPDKFTRLMDSDFVILQVYSPLPEHKYRSPILDTLTSRRSRPGLCTLIYTLNTNLLIGKDLITKERAESKKLVNLSPLVTIFNQRRKSDYKSQLKTWYEMMKFNPEQFVYSKKKLKPLSRLVGNN